MYLFVFKEKLALLNRDLYVDERTSTALNDEWSVAAIKLRKGRADSRKTDVTSVQGDAARFLRDTEAGHIDETVGAVPLNWVPEYDILDPACERPRLLARGWRTTILGLIKKGLVSESKARSVFSYSLGESRHEKLSLAEKFAYEFPEKMRMGDPLTPEEMREIRARSLSK